jgi:sec-independent protein translocase protein TatA
MWRPGIWELVIILAVVLILFGPKRLPQLGKSLGKTMRSLREGVEGKLDDADDDEIEVPGKAEAEATKVKADSSDKTPE